MRWNRWRETAASGYEMKGGSAARGGWNTSRDLESKEQGGINEFRRLLDTTPPSNTIRWKADERGKDHTPHGKRQWRRAVRYEKKSKGGAWQPTNH